MLSDVNLINSDYFWEQLCRSCLQLPHDLAALLICFPFAVALLNLSFHQSLLSPSASFLIITLIYPPLSASPFCFLSPTPPFNSSLCFTSVSSSHHLASLPSVVLTGTGVWGESGDNRWWLHSGGEKRDHHEPPHPSGLDVPVVLPAQVQLPSSGEDLPQGCPEGCARLRWVCSGHFLYTCFTPLAIGLFSLWMWLQQSNKQVVPSMPKVTASHWQSLNRWNWRLGYLLRLLHLIFSLKTNSSRLHYDGWIYGPYAHHPWCAYPYRSWIIKAQTHPLTITSHLTQTLYH